MRRYFEDSHIVDYEKDMGMFYSFKKGYLNAVWNRITMMSSVLWDLTILMVVVFTIHSNFTRAIDLIEQVPDSRQPNPRLRRSYSTSFFCAIVFWFLSTLMLFKVSLRFQSEDTVLYIALNCQCLYLIGNILLSNTREYKLQFYNSVIGYSFMLLFYERQYPYVP